MKRDHFVVSLQIACAAAAAGQTLQEVKQAAEAAAAGTASMGASLSKCIQPGTDMEPNIPGAAMELGLGIHGEAGHQRCTEMMSADATVAVLLKQVRSTNAAQRC